MKNTAALYLRSSKDRSDVSIDALAALIEVIALDPDTQHAEIQYKIDIEDRNSVASPRGRGANAVTLKRAITA